MSACSAVCRSRGRIADPLTVVVSCKDLEPAYMGILSVLMVLYHAHLQHHGLEDVPSIWIVVVINIIGIVVVNLVVFIVNSSCKTVTAYLSLGIRD
jgi:hypothetical protein